MSSLPLTALRAQMPPGTRLGRYEILSTIASGGMATVYLGRQLGAAGFQRLVAIKVLHPHVVSGEFVEMFMDEARLAARIRHPNVVPTLDLENGQDGLFLVMEYIEGDSLLGLLRSAAKAGERIPPTISVRILLDALRGLDAAHELTGDRGEPLRLVHRDVSPHNILVGTDGIARITDFGIARADSRVSNTREGQVKGKLAYMSPEQTSGESVDRRSDVFSLGIVMWETLTGRRLFKGDSDARVLRSLLEAPIPPPTSVAPDLPRVMDQVLERALARDVSQRYATAAELADALEAAGAAIGVASARAVADYVRGAASAKIAEVREVVRAFASAHPSSAPPAASMGPRAQQDSDTAERVARGQVVIPAAAPLAPVPEKNRARVALLVGVGAVLFFGLAAVIVVLLRTPGERASPRDKPDALPRAASAELDPARAPAITATKPPTPVSALPHSEAPQAAPQAPTSRAGHTTKPATSRPATSAPFNPESM